VKLVFASRNLGKVKEVGAVFAALGIDVLSLNDAGVEPSFDVEETGDSFAANAQLKAVEYGKKTGLLTMADDSGLCIDALNGQPGVHSKRFFSGSDHDRNLHVLDLLADQKNRAAFYISVICLYQPSTEKSWCFEGRVDGTMGDAEKGTAGFGYDPLFIPIGYTKTFAELGNEVKNTVSHRAKALAKCSTFLAQQKQEFFL
jgi:XTP/dITP diphosphohydrolase